MNRMKAWLSTRRGQRIFFACLLLGFFGIGCIALFTFRVIRVEFRISLWDIDEHGEYYRVERKQGLDTDVGWIDDAFNGTVYVGDLLGSHTVKAYAKPGYRFWKWDDGYFTPERRIRMHASYHHEAYFVPDRDSDAAELTIKGDSVYLTTRAYKDFKQYALSCTPLGKGGLEAVDGGMLLTLDTAQDIVGTASCHLFLAPCGEKEDTAELFVVAQLAAAEYGGKAGFVELFDGPCYAGLYLAYAFAAFDEAGAFGATIRATALSETAMQTAATYRAGETELWLPLSASVKAHETSAELVSLLDALSYSLPPEAIRRNDYRLTEAGHVPVYAYENQRERPDLDANQQTRYALFCEEIAAYSEELTAFASTYADALRAIWQFGLGDAA